MLKLYGTRGAALAGFLAGLVNSTVAVTELAARSRDSEAHAESPLLTATYQGILLVTTAMLLRNGVLLALLSPHALVAGAALPLILMFSVSGTLAFVSLRRDPVNSASPTTDVAAETIAVSHLESPFSLPAALRYGLIFLALHVAGTLAQRALGAFGFYAVSVVGGLVSSASAVAAAGSLAVQGGITPLVAGIGAVLASLASALVNLPLVARVARQPRLTVRTARALGIVAAAGLLGATLQALGVRALGGGRTNTPSAITAPVVP